MIIESVSNYVKYKHNYDNQMKSILRLYVTTSKGNDAFLYRELMRYGIRPKYDQHLHAFKFDAPLNYMFKIAHRVLTVENMYVQLGQPFNGISQTVFQRSLEKIQFKNYLPLRPGLIENMTLNILVRETQYPLSDNVMTSFIHNALTKQIIKREYHRQIMQGQAFKEALPNFYDMKEIVERKWQLEGEQFQRKQQQMLLQAEKQKKELIGQKQNALTKKQKLEVSAFNKTQSSPNQLLYQIPYKPKMTIYVRRNKAKLLLKVNEQEMYKLGWKKRVGWAPIRQSIATAVLTQTTLLQSHSDVALWDPFCGSGTLSIVAAAIYYSAFVRMDTDNFNWRHWPIFKPEYLKQYFTAEQNEQQQIKGKLKLICSDISFQASNYTLSNLKQLEKSINSQTSKQEIRNEYKEVLYKRIKPSEQWTEIMNGQWVVGCGDFQKLADNILIQGRKTNIITNLPYLKARSAEHMPLNQLISLYRRFSKMLKKYKQRIANVFILIDNQNINHPNHFLAVSDEEWILTNSFDSGGMEIGLYAWKNNELKAKYEDLNSIVETLKKEVRQINKIPEQQLHTALTNYRQKIKELQKKYYYLPKHMLKIKRGWRRVVEKRRRRHLLRAYELFAKRRDKLIAFTTYARKKLEINMLRRGAVWRRRNTKILSGIPIQALQKQLAKEFQGKIEQALKKNEQHQNYRKMRAKQSNAERQKAKLVEYKFKTKRQKSQIERSRRLKANRSSKKR